MITIPESDDVYAVTVEPYTAWPGTVEHVRLRSVGTTIVVDGQALANALAELGYHAEDAPAPLTDHEGLAATVDRLIDRIGSLETLVGGVDSAAANIDRRVTALEATGSRLRLREPREGDRYCDRTGDVWTVGADGLVRLSMTGIGCEFAQVRRSYGPLTPCGGS